MRGPGAILALLLSATAVYDRPVLAAGTTTTSAVSINMSGKGTVPSDGVFFGTASGGVSPFGQGRASVSGSGVETIVFNFTISFTNGSSFSASVSGADLNVVTASGNITGGTGALAGATGTLSMTFTRSYATETDFTFTMVGSGSITTEAVSAVPTVTPSSLSLLLTQGTTAPASEGIVAGNPSLNPIPFTAAASGGSWLTLAQTGGSIPGFSTFLIGVNANPAGLSAGIYNGQVTVTITGQTFTVPVQLVVSSPGPNLSLPQSGLFFQVESGAGAPPAQIVDVENTGTGNLVGIAVTTAVTSGQDWLTTSVPSNRSVNQLPITVGVNPTGLAAGTYYGRVIFTVPGASNSPVSSTVVLNVTAATASIGGTALPSGLIFAAPLGSQNPNPQNVTIANLSNQPLTLSTLVDYSQEFGWISLTPSSGTVPVGQPVTMQVSVGSAGFSTGVYNAVIHVEFAEDGSDHAITVVLVVTNGSNSQAVPKEPHPVVISGCTPTTLLSVFTALGDEFTTTAGWPVPLQVQVNDDCGTPITMGSVVTSFSTGDPAISLTSTGAGLWAGTWLPRAANSQVAISAQAQTTAAPVLTGSVQILGSAVANTGTPVVSPGGVVSAASYAAGVPTAPGAFVAIFGNALAPATGVNVSPLPFAPQLAGTQGLLGGQPIPLYFTSTGQINGVVPYGLPANSMQQLLVQSGSALSQPESVLVGAAQPAVFTQNNSGTGAGSILVQNAAGSVFLATASAPATAGDALLIFCAGLGAVTPDVPAGTAAPSSPLAMTENPVTVTVGGKSAQVAFAGLAPTFAGLYQVNVVVPSGIAAASDVPVILTVDGVSSAPVTVAIH